MYNKVTNKNWDLSKISNDLSLKEIIDSWKDAAFKESTLRKNLAKSLENFKKWWFALLKIRNIDAKIKLIEREFDNTKDKTDEQKDWLKELDNARKAINESFGKVPSVYKLLNKNRKVVLKYVNSDPDLKKFKLKIQLDYLDDENHTISEEDRKIRNATWGTDAVEKIYDALRKDSISDTVRDENDKIVDAECWEDMTQSWNEHVRKGAYRSIYTLPLKHRHTLFWISTIAANRLQQNAKYYKFNNWIDQSIFNRYLISNKQYSLILEQAEKFAPLSIAFNSYIQKIITHVYGLKKYEPWDFDLEVQDRTDNISAEQARKLIKDSLACLGSEYAQQIDLCYKHNIIKWDKTQQTEGAGFCFAKLAQLDEHPIRFNWDGSSLATTILSHELGHNIRNKFIKKYNEIDVDDNDLLVEIPSIVNSVISHLYLIKQFKQNKAPKEQLYGLYYDIIRYLINNICYGGYVIHLAFFGTEYLLKDNADNEGFETEAFKLKRDIYGLSKEHFKKIDKKAPYWYEALDCYRTYLNTCFNGIDSLQYYVGSVVALVVGTKIFNGDKDMLNKYYKFLKSGTSLDPIKVVKSTLGIDLLKPQIYTEAKQILNKWINEFKKDIKI